MAPSVSPLSFHPPKLSLLPPPLSPPLPFPACGFPLNEKGEKTRMEKGRGGGGGEGVSTLMM